MSTDREKIVADYVINHAQVLVLEFDEAGILKDASHCAVDLLGSVIIGKSFRDIFRDLPSATDFATWISALKKEASLDVVTADRTPQTWRFLTARTAGRTLLLGHRDVTEIEFLQHRLIKLNAGLTNMTRELQMTNAKLSEVNNLKNQFLGAAAHDLRNPLGVILNYGEFLLDEVGPSLTEEHRGFISSICKSSSFMLGLVNNLLDAVQIDAGQLALNREPVDLPKLVGQNIALNRVLSSKKRISLEFVSDPESFEVDVDPGKIEQVLNNLITNAVKFSLPGTTVRIHLAEQSGIVEIRVIDQGVGIPKSELGKLFKPFSKTSVRATANEPCTGLGLAIAHRIVEGHGGKLTVESRPGKGSTFTVRFPALQKGEGKPGTTRQEPASHSTSA